MARPRTVSPPADECIKLGKEMVAWVRENKPTHLSEWYSLEKHIIFSKFNAMCETAEFLPYYEEALWIVARNARNGTLDKSIAQRFLSMYHKDLKKHERDEKQFESDLKKKETDAVDEQVKAQASALLSQLDAMQSERRMERNSISKDEKS
jgi:hypothetical protein